MPLPITPLALLGIAAISVAITVLLALHIWYSRLDRRRSRNCSNDIELESVGGVRGGGGGEDSAVSVDDEGRPGQRADGLDAAPPRAVSYGVVGLGDERRDMHDGGWVPRGKRAGVGGGTVRGGGYPTSSGGIAQQSGGDGGGGGDYFDDWRRNQGGGQRSSSVYSRDTTVPTLMQHDYTYHPVSAAYPGPPAPAPAAFVVGYRSGENDGVYPFPVRYGGGVRYNDDDLTTTTTGALDNMSDYEHVRPRTSMDVVRSASAIGGDGGAMGVRRSASADVVQGQQGKQKQKQKQQQPLKVHPWRLSYT